MEENSLFKVSGAEGTVQDVEAIRQLIANAAEYQNEPERFLNLHSPDAIIVNFVGKRVFGRVALENTMKNALSGSLARVITRNAIENIRFLRPDVAIVSCTKYVSDQRQEATNGNGHQLPAEKGALTYLVVKENQSWAIAMAQTTPIINL